MRPTACLRDHPIPVDEFIATAAVTMAGRAERELEALVGVSSPSGDVQGAEEAVAVCVALLPEQARVERVPCSTSGSAPDLLAVLEGKGTRTPSWLTRPICRCAARQTGCMARERRT